MNDSGEDDWETTRRNVEFVRFGRADSLEIGEGGRDRNETK